MEERISQLLNGKQFFDFGTVVFASNQPAHVCLLEVEGENDKLYTVLYDQKHDFLDISARSLQNDEAHLESVNLTAEQQHQIKQLLENSKNNV